MSENFGTISSTKADGAWALDQAKWAALNHSYDETVSMETISKAVEIGIKAYIESLFLELV